MSTNDSIPRTALPIPSPARTGLITYDAKDPDTKYPPIRATAASAGRPQRPRRPARRCRLRGVERLRRAVSHAERGKAGGEWFEVQPLPHHGAVLADASGAADRPQPPFGWHGRHHRDRERIARLLLRAAEHRGAAGQDAQAEWLRDRAVRQVPRSAGVADQSGRTVRCMANRRRRLRVLLRVHRRRGAPVVPVAVRRDNPDRGQEDARRGLPLHGGHDRQGDRLDRPAEGPDARQAVLHLLRARRHARAASRPQGMGGQVQGQVRRRLGHAARGDVRAAEEARRHSRELPSSRSVTNRFRRGTTCRRR